MVWQPWGDTRAGLRLLFTANLLVSHSDSSIIERSGFPFRGKREHREKQTAGAATQTGAVVGGMAGSLEGAQAACMSEIQTDSLPTFQATEEYPTQQDKQNQSCNVGDFLTHVETNLQEQLQAEHDRSEYGEQLQPGISLEQCWYCIKSLPMEDLSLPQLQLENEASTLPYGGERMSYQKDPRPHFGVARSSHSIPFPLWDSEGPKEMKREAYEEDTDSFTSCPHCHLGLRLDTLRWHEEKCLLFEGQREDA
ncbi:hypothetical protein MHYP_G00191640 [Metynnis hypsauchen]